MSTYPLYLYKDGEAVLLKDFKAHEEHIKEHGKGWLNNPDPEYGRPVELDVPKDVILERRESAFEKKKQKMIDEELGKSESADTEPDAADLSSLTKAELHAMAEERGLKVPKKATKSDIIDALNGED
jgi:Rho termination factor, N-terminal domain.